MAFRHIMGLAAAATLAAGCAEGPTGEAPLQDVLTLDGLRFELALDKEVIPVGDSGVVTITLKNENAAAVTLNFNSTCQILPFVEDASGTFQYPSEGLWGCGAMLTTLTVPANGFVTRTLVVRGVAESPAGGAGAALVPGEYGAYATLDFYVQTQPSPSPAPRRLRSPTLEFEVR